MINKLYKYYLVGFVGISCLLILAGCSKSVSIEKESKTLLTAKALEAVSDDEILEDTEIVWGSTGTKTTIPTTGMCTSAATTTSLMDASDGVSAAIFRACPGEYTSPQELVLAINEPKDMKKLRRALLSGMSLNFLLPESLPDSDTFLCKNKNNPSYAHYAQFFLYLCDAKKAAGQLKCNANYSVTHSGAAQSPYTFFTYKGIMASTSKLRLIVSSNPDVIKTDITNNKLITNELNNISDTKILANRNGIIFDNANKYQTLQQAIPLINKYITSYVNSCYKDYSAIFNSVAQVMSKSVYRSFFVVKPSATINATSFACEITNLDCMSKLVDVAIAQQGNSQNCNELPKYCNKFEIGSVGCFTPDQHVRLPSGSMPIGEAKESFQKEIMTLTPDSTFESPALKSSQIAYFTSDEMAYEQSVLTIKTAGGVTLKVTKGHPLLDADGKIKLSENFKAGDALIRTDGSLDVILSIIGESMVYRAFNVAVQSENLLEQIIVAGDGDGVLSGSHYYQVREIDHLKRILTRINIPEHLVQ
ncbi:MAG: hypothetical protein HY072_04385 [Deltaproteobacteria bacterium]|nr:hypothetical protein [Deltaproteobacteria bacterium]